VEVGIEVLETWCECFAWARDEYVQGKTGKRGMSIGRTIYEWAKWAGVWGDGLLSEHGMHSRCLHGVWQDGRYATGR
jgi:hypothetical protein